VPRAVEAPGECLHALLMPPMAHAKTLKKRNLHESHFHFIVQPTGVVSVVEGSRPASTASRASLR
jgi:hypothetical protein